MTVSPRWLLLTSLLTLAAPLAPLVSLTAARADDPPPSEVRLPLAEYEALMAAARNRAGAQPTWTTGGATMRLPDATHGFVSVQIDGTLQVVGDGLSEVVLLPGHVVIDQITIDGAEAALVRKNSAHVVLLKGDSGTHSVTLRYQVPTQPASDGATLAVVPLPPLPGLRVTVEPNGVATPIDLWPSGSVMSPAPNLVVQIPATPAVVLRWGAGSELIRSVDYHVTIEPGSDGATVVAKIDVQLDGTRAAVSLIPSTIALVDIQEGGKPLATKVAGGWHQAIVNGPGRHTIEATFRMGIDRSQGQPELTLPLAPAPIIRVEAKVPGKRAVEFSPAVPLKTTTIGDDPNAFTTAIGHLPPSPTVAIKWTEPRSAPEQVVSVNTETYQLVKIDEGVVRSKVEIRYEIIRGSLKELPVQLPDQAVLYKVTGEGIEDWRTFAATDTDPRQARIFLGSDHEGQYKLELELEQVAPQTVGQPVDVPIVRPLGAGREMGVVALFDGVKVGFAEATLPAQGAYVKSGEDALPTDVRQKLSGDIVSQAYKHLGAPAAMKSAVAAAKTREIRFDAHIETLYTFQQNALTVRASVEVDVKSGRTDRIVLSLPKGVKVGTDLSAPSLKKADWVEGQDPTAARQDYEVLLTRALEGSFRIELSLEVIIGSDLGKLTPPDVQIKDADVKKGDLGITADPGVEITQGASSGLRKLDLTELPNSIRLRSRREVQLGYSFSYVDEPWKLELEVRRHRTVETLTASVQGAWIETTVLSDGQMLHTALFRVDNKDRDFLGSKLPADARILEVTVDGGRVEPIEDVGGGHKIKIPKQKTSLVEIVYLTKREGGLGFMASLDLVAPKPDIFAKNIQWRVRVPSKLALLRVSTDLEEVDPSRYQSPPEHATSHLTAGFDGNEEFTDRLFTLDVLDTTDTRTLTVAMTTVSAPPAIGWLLFVAALAFMGMAVWGLAKRRAGRRAAVLIGAAVALLVLKSLAWGLGGGEVALVAFVVIGVGVAAWIVTKRKAVTA